jgi:hypothetical protein
MRALPGLLGVLAALTTGAGAPDLAITDTWIPSRWADLADLQRGTRAWLRQLPADVAERIASGNAERLAAR